MKPLNITLDVTRKKQKEDMFYFHSECITCLEHKNSFKVNSICHLCFIAKEYAFPKNKLFRGMINILKQKLVGIDLQLPKTISIM
jgi:hypothetical protein